MPLTMPLPLPLPARVLPDPGALRYVPRVRRAGVLLLSGALLALAAPAWAQPAQPTPSAADLARARTLFDEADKAEAAEQWAEALDKLREVERIKATPVVYYHMGICEEKLGRLGDAVEHYEQSEALARTQNNGQVQAMAAEKVAKVAPRVPRVTITVTPEVDKAEVLLDGVVLPPDKRELRLNPSRPYKVEVRAPGRVTFIRQLFLAEGARETVRARMAVAYTPGTELPPTMMDANTTEYGEPERPQASSGLPLGTWIAGGSALALGAGGLVTFLVSSGINSDARDRCPGEVAATCLPEEAESDQSTVHTLDRVALGLWIGAGVAAGVAVTIWVLDPGTKRTSGVPATPRVAIEARPGGAVLRGQF